MTNVSVSPDVRSPRSLWHKAPLWMHIVVVATAFVLAAGFVFVSTNWPYRYRKIKPMLEDVLASQVKISRYHRTYFPHPGFMATGITMRRKSAPDLPPLGTVETMVVQGSWLDLVMLRDRVQLVDITGLHIVVPAIGSRENHEDFPPGSSADFEGPTTKIDRMVVHKSLLDIMRADGNRLSFPIAQLELRSVHKGEAMTYAVDMRNAQPTGRIRAYGGLGPIHPDDMGSTPVSGEFAFSAVELHDVGDINGTLDSRGQFEGTLGAIEADAIADTPNFAVDKGQHSSVRGTIHCTVDATNGDLNISSIVVTTGRTSVLTKGTITGSPKTANLDFAVTRGRAEDVLRPFVHQDVPIAGPVWLHGHAYVGPAGNGAGFLQRLRVDGVFNVPAERIQDKQTQKSLSEFSRRAQGEKTDNANANQDDRPQSSSADALSSLKGPVTIRDGIASTERLDFQIPGAQANLAGTFNFHNQSVHLLGNLKMDEDISHTSTGFKSWLLKPLAPFFKKNHVGALVPIAVTGGPGSYKVTSDLTHSK